MPLLIPPGETRTGVVLESIDALVLAGGGDIDPAVYGGTMHETVYMTDPERDEMELALTRAALDARMPMLAICRGIQVVNVALGGTVHAHLPDVFGEAVNHRLPPREPVLHPVRLEPGCRTAAVLGVTECEPMSWHHQAIDQLAPSLTVVAWAPDDVPEAIEIEGHEQVLAVQWHPEETAETDPIQQKLFNWLARCACD